MKGKKRKYQFYINRAAVPVYSVIVAKSYEKNYFKIMVLLEGIELSTSPLPRECSTTELQQLPACFLWITANAVNPDCKKMHRRH
jgi:hypothetical protein